MARAKYEMNQMNWQKKNVCMLVVSSLVRTAVNLNWLWVGWVVGWFVGLAGLYYCFFASWFVCWLARSLLLVSILHYLSPSISQNLVRSRISSSFWCICLFAVYLLFFCSLWLFGVGYLLWQLVLFAYIIMIIIFTNSSS